MHRSTRLRFLYLRFENSYGTDQIGSVRRAFADIGNAPAYS
jgi:hypothetical protein